MTDTHTTPVRFSQWLKRAGLTHAQAAERLGVKRAQVCHVALGRRSPSLVLAGRIQTLTGIPAVDWIKRDDIQGVPV